MSEKCCNNNNKNPNNNNSDNPLASRRTDGGKNLDYICFFLHGLAGQGGDKFYP